jgi:putative beta-lysine N-acetyltransferase
MPDIIEKIGKSIIQHGPHNQRVYLMKPAKQDAHRIIADLNRLSQSNKYEKILCKIHAGDKATYEKHGYEQEAVIPGYFNDGKDAVFMSKYFILNRKRSTDQKRIREILSLAFQRKLHPETATKACSFTPHTCGQEDTHEMSLIFKAVFKTYPFPIFDADYLSQVIKKKQAQYFCIRKEERIVAIAAAEIDADNRGAEMTDFATLPEFRGQGLAKCLLAVMEQSMTKKGMKTAFSIARALSPGMNILFAINGYYFGGTLVNNTNIAGDIESMNVWYKQLL